MCKRPMTILLAVLLVLMIGGWAARSTKFITLVSGRAYLERSCCLIVNGWRIAIDPRNGCELVWGADGKKVTIYMEVQD